MCVRWYLTWAVTSIFCAFVTCGEVSAWNKHVLCLLWNCKNASTLSQDESGCSPFCELFFFLCWLSSLLQRPFDFCLRCSIFAVVACVCVFDIQDWTVPWSYSHVFFFKEFDSFRFTLKSLVHCKSTFKKDLLLIMCIQLSAVPAEARKGC